MRSPTTWSAWSSRGSPPWTGVQRADILGGRMFAMRMWLKPDKMAALNVSPAQVRQALAANNYLSAIGQTKGSLVQVNLTANTDLRSVKEFQQLVMPGEGRLGGPARRHRRRTTSQTDWAPGVSSRFAA